MRSRISHIGNFFVLLVVVLSPLRLSGQIDSLLRQLDQTISKRSSYLGVKYRKIHQLRSQLEQDGTAEQQFELLSQLCEAYQSFHFDTALLYSQQLVSVATRLARPEGVAKARIRQAFILLSGGFFHEALDSLQLIDRQHCDALTTSHFYFTAARSCLDLASLYHDHYYLPIYHEQGMRYLDSAILYSRENELLHRSQRALRAMNRGEMDTALLYYQKLVDDPQLPSRQLAVEASCLSNVYSTLDDEEQAMVYMIKAAQADEVNCVRETTALMRIATALHFREDYQRSDHYIDVALADANFYGAHLRRTQILDILPLIKARQVTLSEQKRRQWLFSFIIVIILLLACLLLIYQNVKKNLALEKKEKKLSEAYRELERYTHALVEADKIKENYIGHFFQRHTKFINYADGIFRNVRKAVAEHNPQDTQYHLKQFNGRKEQQKLQQDFDRAFLRVFPNFVQEFNRLFPPEHQFSSNGQDLLSTELRIFALVRLGIRNNETIARALDYSVNTIYTYKTRVRNRSLLSSEEFDRTVLEISGFLTDNGSDFPQKEA